MPESSANAMLRSVCVKTVKFLQIGTDCAPFLPLGPAQRFNRQPRILHRTGLCPSPLLGPAQRHGRQPRRATRLMDVLAEKWEGDLLYLCLVQSLAYCSYPGKFLLNELRTGCHKNKGVCSKQVSNMLCLITQTANIPSHTKAIIFVIPSRQKLPMFHLETRFFSLFFAHKVPTSLQNTLPSGALTMSVGAPGPGLSAD